MPEPIVRQYPRMMGLCIFTTAAAAFAQAPSTSSGQAHSTSSGQAYPTRPVRVVVPFAPGGGIDFAARLTALHLQQQLAQNFIVDNRPGAGGIVGSEVVAKAAADGYTLLATPISHAVNISLTPRMPFHPEKDFAPIVHIASAANIVLVHPSVPARSAAELVKLARARPGELSFASSGSGSSTHLATELFRMLAKIDLLHVPYKGGGPALSDLIGGQVSMYFASLPAAGPHLKSGRLRAIGVTGRQRATTLPELPTVSESGVPGYEYVGWYGLLAPAATPAAIVARLNAEANKFLKNKEFSDRIAADGAEPAGGTPEAFAAFIHAEIAKWARVIKHSGMGGK
jgi:tripartite-type tricarboxylate transporter receptor subunit TctC